MQQQRCHPRHLLAFALAVILLSAAPRSGAQEPPPSCAAETAGLVACVAGKLCACGFARGGAVAGGGVPAGYRWDCGVLRPACGEPSDRPATLDRYPYPLPPALGLDRRHGSDASTVTGGGDRAHNARKADGR